MRTLLPLLICVGAFGCAGSRETTDCKRIPGCPDSPCCEEAIRCAARVCHGVPWVCLGGDVQLYRWFERGPSCGTDGGPDARPDASAELGIDDLGGFDGPCTAGSCGPHASCVGGSCVCERYYIDADGARSTGCECFASNCGSCPTGACGPNADCRDDERCRCSSGDWNNLDDDWNNGCEARVYDCRADNCNVCYTGYCGPRADCMQNSCACVDPAWSDCDGVWEKSGCECEGVCGSCQP